jgi:DNA-binding transcriptional ArsR family regulator
MSNVMPLARGPLSASEAAILDAIPLTSTSPQKLQAATGLSDEAVEEALAQLYRRGLVRRTDSQVSRVSGRPARSPRRLQLLHGRQSAGHPTPTLPAA